MPCRAAAAGAAPASKGDRAAAERFRNFRAATEAERGELEREHQQRRDRYRRLEAAAAGLTCGEQEAALKAFAQREEQGLLARCKVWTTADFEQVAILGEGGYGVVHLVRRVGTQEYYALKQMRKEAYKKKSSRARAFAERNLLAGTRSRWFVNLLTTFQDAQHVYMAMEFLQGGDFLTHIVRLGRLTPRETCFYMAELLEALDAVHRSGFIHRDVKPDNIVLNGSGHLKLLDFGLCAEQLRDEPLPTAGGRRARLRSAVGTPLYMAPEMLEGKYGAEVDIWSFGVLTYECLTGVQLFDPGDLAQDAAMAFEQFVDLVKNHRTYVPAALHRARDRFVSPSAEQLILAVLCERERRLVAEDCRKEPFFAGIDWARLHLLEPPIEIKVSSPADLKYFQANSAKLLDTRYQLPPPNASELAMKDEALEWAHYEFDRRCCELQEAEPSDAMDALRDGGANV